MEKFKQNLINTIGKMLFIPVRYENLSVGSRVAIMSPAPKEEDNNWDVREMTKVYIHPLSHSGAFTLISVLNDTRFARMCCADLTEDGFFKRVPFSNFADNGILVGDRFCILYNPLETGLIYGMSISGLLWVFAGFNFVGFASIGLGAFFLIKRFLRLYFIHKEWL